MTRITLPQFLEANIKPIYDDYQPEKMDSDTFSAWQELLCRSHASDKLNKEYGGIPLEDNDYALFSFIMAAWAVATNGSTDGADIRICSSGSVVIPELDISVCEGEKSVAVSAPYSSAGRLRYLAPSFQAAVGVRDEHLIMPEDRVPKQIGDFSVDGGVLRLIVANQLVDKILFARPKTHHSHHVIS